MTPAPGYVRDATPAELAEFRRSVPHAERAVWVDEFVADEDWIPATPSETERRRCRRPRCGNAPVAALMRLTFVRSRLVRRPWLYCANHVYGRTYVPGPPPQLLAIRAEAGAS